MVDRKKFEFRKVLGRVSDGLGHDNIQALKNLCYDMIGERRREGLDSGVSLFNALIEEGKRLNVRVLNCACTHTHPLLTHKHPTSTHLLLIHTLTHIPSHIYTHTSPPHTHIHTLAHTHTHTHTHSILNLVDVTHAVCCFIACLCLYLCASDVIGPEKAEFLCELLDTVGRKDLTVIVKEYIDKVSCKLNKLNIISQYLCVCGG